jgi:hypothetical protein
MKRRRAFPRALGFLAKWSTAAIVLLTACSSGVGNRAGLRELARVCLALADLPEHNEESKRLGNHYHFADYMNTLEEGSTPFILLYQPNL